MSNNGTLFSDFEAITEKQWIEKIQKELKGKSFERLFWHPEDNLVIPPFYTKKDLNELPHLYDKMAQKALRLPHGKWRIAEKFNLSCNDIISQVNIALQNDVNTLVFNVPETGLKQIDFLIDFLKNKSGKIQKLSFRGQNIVLQKLVNNDPVLNFISANPKIQFLFGFNFLSELTLTGKQSLDTEFIPVLKKKFSIFPNVRFLLVNGNDFANAGASVVQQLAYSLAIGNAYLPYFEDMNNVVNRIEFLFATGNNYFFEIAKLRTFRILWAKLLQLNDKKFDSPETIYLTSETSIFNKTIYDPYVNMLRNTTEAMASVVGGINELTILPFNILFAKDDDFGWRIARNVQHILCHETHLDTVADISAGSYYIENLTHLLAENTWQLFQEIVNAGNYETLAMSGKIKQDVEANAEKIIQKFNKRKKVLVGINNYPDISEEILKKINAGELEQSSGNSNGLRQFHLSGQIENIRLKTERAFTKKPKVFMFTYGNLTMRRARAGFSLNFLGAAGFQILDNNGFNSVTEGIEMFNRSGADILVVCSSDEEYPDLITNITKRINNKILVVAGNPKEINVSANVDYFIFSGSNILDTLRNIQEQLFRIKETV